MELISGIARNVHTSTDANTLNLVIGSRDVRLRELGDRGEDSGEPEDPGERENPSPVQDGDDVIVAGRPEDGAFAGYACWNVTQGLEWRASIRSDVFQGTLSLILSAAFIWAGLIADSEVPILLWIQRVAGFGLGLLFAVFAIIYVVLIAEKFLARFLVSRAALESLAGTASNVRLATDHSAAYLDIGGRAVELFMPCRIVMADGDEVVVTGRRHGDVLAGMGYRNVTRGIIGRRRIILGLAWTLLQVGAFTALVIAGLWFGEEDVGFFIALRRALALALMMSIAIFALDRILRWRLDLEAWRRVKAGP